MATHGNMRPPSAVVFDFDGTLISKQEPLVRLVDRGAIRDEECLRALLDLRERYFLPSQKGGLSPKAQRHWLEGTFEVYIRSRLTLDQAYAAIDGVRVRQGVPECLERLKSAGVPVGIVSFGVWQFIRRVLRRNRLDGLVDRVYASRLLTEATTGVISGWNPDTVVFPRNKGVWSRRFADIHRVPHARILAVGDTHGDDKLGYLTRNRLGIAAVPAEARALDDGSFGRVIVTEGFAPVTDWIFSRLRGFTSR